MKRSFYFCLIALFVFALLLMAGLIYLGLKFSPLDEPNAPTATENIAPADFETGERVRQTPAADPESSTPVPRPMGSDPVSANRARGGDSDIVSLSPSPPPLPSSSPDHSSETLPDTPEKQSVQAKEIQTHEAMKQALSLKDLKALESVIDTLERQEVPSLSYELPLLKIAADCMRSVNSETQLAARDAMQTMGGSTIRKWIRRICEIP